MPPSAGTRMQTRQPFAAVNGGQDPPREPLNSDSGVAEFNKEDIEALLNDKLKLKNRFSLKVKLYCGYYL